jgi:hypothetical protein
MNIDEIEKGIEKTGFRLEFNVSKILEKNGWIVINNKYYVDDQQETVREIDIVAYKASLVRGVHIYTALILSCKKNEKNAWALLSKEPDHNDPNIEWTPVHAWSNDRVLSFMLEEHDWKDTYLLSLKKSKSKIVCSKLERHIFGFQEMNKESGLPQNDKNIFNSITSAMKAQAYEKNALPLRKKNPCLFQFNLLSVAQTDLVRLDFKEISSIGTSVEDEVYVASYIVDKQQTYARVHFVQSEAFSAIIKQYNLLHKANKVAFAALYEKFCDEIKTDHKKANLFRKDVAEDIWWSVHCKLKHLPDLQTLLQNGWIEWDKKEETLEFQLDIDSDDVELINSQKSLRRELSMSLKEHYSYEGTSNFAISDIPF